MANSPVVEVNEMEIGEVSATYNMSKDTGLHICFDSVNVHVPGPNGGDKKQVIKDISGEACPGEILAIMGPTGSGKTTLLSVLSHTAQSAIEVKRQSPTMNHRLKTSPNQTLTALLEGAGECKLQRAALVQGAQTTHRVRGARRCRLFRPHRAGGPQLHCSAPSPGNRCAGS